MSGQRGRRWANIKTVLVKEHMLAELLPLSIGYSRPSVGVVLGQRRRQFVDIEPAMGWDIGPTLNQIGWVGPHRLYRRGTRNTIQILNGWRWCWNE